MELYQRFTLTQPAGTISDAGIREIYKVLNNVVLKSEAWAALNPDTKYGYLPNLPDTWAWVWIVSKGEYAGTMSKRIRKFYFKQYAIKCPDAFIEQIGQIARAHSAESVTFAFEFVDTFDWQDGDFGDEGSCYWGSNEGARDMLAEHDALAVCFYDENETGIARAWLCQIKDMVYVLWNGYGFTNATMTIARIVAAHLNLSYKKIALTNNGTGSGTLWINSNSGYAIGAVEVVEAISGHDFGWEDLHAYACENCGRSLSESDVYYGADENTYCQDCYYEHFDSCYHCGETYYRDNISYIDDESVCDHCLVRLYVTCDECGDYVHNTRAVHTKKGVFCERHG